MKRAGLVLVVVLCACSAAASVRADTPPPPVDTTTTAAVATIADGVVLGGVAVGGLAPDVATQAVSAQFAQPVVLRLGGTTISVAPSLLGVSVPADAAVAKALTVAPGTSLGLRATVDQNAVATFVAGLAARYDHEPADARLLLRGYKPLVTPSMPGLAIDQPATVRLLTAELEHGTRTPIALPARTPPPKVKAVSYGPVIVIRRSSNLLTLYHGMTLVREFRVATGENVYPTPLGRFQIVVMWKNPWWYPPASPWAKGRKPVPPGPSNPLGTRWMGLSSPGVGIHGTPESASIGYSLSHGCIRMLIPQAEWLFDHVTVGTPVFIISD
jgi:lipoprotein-anchoring transpeptidase ErfK/SrfK